MGKVCQLQPGQKAIIFSTAILEQSPGDLRLELLSATGALSTGDVVIICGRSPGVQALRDESLIASIVGDHRLTYVVIPEDDLLALGSSVTKDERSSHDICVCSSLEITYDGQGLERLLVDPGPSTTVDPRTTLLQRLTQQGSRFHDATDLDPEASIARYIVSRSFYQRVRVLLLWITIPLLAILAVRIPLLLSIPVVNRRPIFALTSSELVSLMIALDVALAVAVSAVTSRSMLRVLDTPLDTAMRAVDPNAQQRHQLDDLSQRGYHGLISGATRSAELLMIAGEVFASPGNFAKVLNRTPMRLPLPSLYLMRTNASWLEIEAGVTLRLSLWSHQRLMTRSRLLTLLASRELRRPNATLLAATPSGPFFSPIATALHDGTLRFRRISATVVFIGGVVQLASTLIPPLHRHVQLIAELFPNMTAFVRNYANALAAAAGVAMVAVALGLHAGRRRSFQITIGVGIVAFLVNLARGGDLLASIVLGAVLITMVANRRAFDQPAPRRASIARLGRTVATAALLWLVADIATIVAHVLFYRHLPYRPLSAIGQIIRVSVGLSAVAPPPFGHPDLRDALQLSMFVLLLIAIWTVIAPLSARVHFDGRSAHGIAALSRMLSAHPQGTLDYFALRDDKLHWVRYGVLIAYGIFGSAVIVSPDPIGPRSNSRLAFVEFFTEMRRQGYAIAILGASAEWQTAYQSLNMRSYYIGDEAIVALGELDLGGKRHKSLRQAVNRMKNYGYSVTLANPNELAVADREQILTIMAASRRGDRERGFSMTLGRIFDPRDSNLLMSICRDHDRRITGFCQWVPAPAVNGFSLDLMRRDLADHPNGMFDLLIVETMRQLGDQGYRFLSLNFAAMRAVLAGERGGSGLPSRVERWVLGRLSESMQIESLWHFNAKFDPRWLARYLVVDTIENLPAIAIAAAKAESLWDLPEIGRFLNDS